MLKYVNTGIVFQEIPNEVTLAINISNCPCHCPGCHSHYLWEDIGLPLNTDAIDSFAAEYGKDITCISFMGGDNDPKGVNQLAQYIHEEHPEFKVAWYSGKTIISPKINKQDFDYIKIGPYIRHLGAYNKPAVVSPERGRYFRGYHSSFLAEIASASLSCAKSINFCLLRMTICFPLSWMTPSEANSFRHLCRENFWMANDSAIS